LHGEAVPPWLLQPWGAQERRHMNRDAFAIRSHLDRLGLGALTDVVLATDMSWENVKTMAVFALRALDCARAGQVPTKTMGILAGDTSIPDPVYDRLYEIISEAAIDAVMKFPSHGRTH
jgi:hypothetical protein